jgi:hypothetical protein
MMKWEGCEKGAHGKCYDNIHAFPGGTEKTKRNLHGYDGGSSYISESCCVVFQL